MSDMKKCGDTGGVAQWSDLGNLGDARRMLKWVASSLRNRTMTTSEANAFTTLANALAGLMKQEREESVAQRLDQLENLLALLNHQQNGAHHTE